MFRKKPDALTVEDVINNTLSQMDQYPADSEEFAAMAKNLEVLTRAKSEKDRTHAISADTLLAAGVNISGILLILNYEKLDVVTSKAFSLLAKSKI